MVSGFFAADVSSEMAHCDEVAWVVFSERRGLGNQNDRLDWARRVLWRHSFKSLFSE